MLILIQPGTTVFPFLDRWAIRHGEQEAIVKTLEDAVSRLEGWKVNASGLHEALRSVGELATKALEIAALGKGLLTFNVFTVRKAGGTFYLESADGAVPRESSSSGIVGRAVSWAGALCLAVERKAAASVPLGYTQDRLKARLDIIARDLFHGIYPTRAAASEVPVPVRKRRAKKA